MFHSFASPEAVPIVDLMGRLLIAALLAGIIGFERQMRGRPAGLRTHMLLGMGVAMFTGISLHIGDAGRIAAQVITGIGFLGAGTIMRLGVEVKGLTTAASVWATAAISMAVAIGGSWIIVAELTTLIVLLTLIVVDQLEHRYIDPRTQRSLIVELDSRETVQDILEKLAEDRIALVGIRAISADPLQIAITIEAAARSVVGTVAAIPGVKSVQLEE